MQMKNVMSTMKKIDSVDAVVQASNYEMSAIDALHHCRAQKRREAAWLLGLLRSKHGVPELVGLLSRNDDDWAVLAEAAHSLGLIADRRAVGVLCLRLHDSYLAVRRECALALVRIGDRAAVPHLWCAARDDPSPSVRCAVRAAVKKLESEKV